MFYIYKSHDKKITIKNFTIKFFFPIFRKLIRPGYENLKNLFARPNRSVFMSLGFMEQKLYANV